MCTFMLVAWPCLITGNNYNQLLAYNTILLSSLCCRFKKVSHHFWSLALCKQCFSPALLSVDTSGKHWPGHTDSRSSSQSTVAGMWQSSGQMWSYYCELMHVDTWKEDSGSMPHCRMCVIPLRVVQVFWCVDPEWETCGTPLEIIWAKMALQKIMCTKLNPSSDKHCP